MNKDLAASVRARLLNVAKAQGADFNQVLVRFALERILYRLSQSAHADHFLLKGALLFTLWYDMPHRTTRDADLLGFGPSDLESIAQTFRDIASVEVEDGIVFDPATVSVEEIRKDAGYAGARVLITGEIARARCKTQIHIGFGDAVTPGPVHAVYPVLIADLPAPRLRTYPVYTVISEKLHAIALLGMTNSRLKDYLDLWVLLDRETANPLRCHRLVFQLSATTRVSIKFFRKMRKDMGGTTIRIRPEDQEDCSVVFSPSAAGSVSRRTVNAQRVSIKAMIRSTTGLSAKPRPGSD
jgi:predicted nucleotidyltransferase component of viral defense system